MQPTIQESDFGRLPDDRPVVRYLLDNGAGITLSLINYGGIITGITMPDRNGTVGEITLAYDTLESYLKGHPYFGAMVGRVANRISGGGFTLDDKRYDLALNTGSLHLHGGVKGFDKKLFSSESFGDEETVGVRLEMESPDGEEGYPGTLTTVIVVSLNREGIISFDYELTTDRATPVNVTNHTYWNLSGAGTVFDHQVRIHASRFVETDDALLPTGRLLPVADSAFDFTSSKAIGRDFPEVRALPTGGYDHCYCVDGWESSDNSRLLPVADVFDPASGRSMTVRATTPGVQFYTGNHLPEITGRNGEVLHGQEAFCLETQYYPDSVNRPEFPDSVLRPDSTLRMRAEYELSVGEP